VESFHQPALVAALKHDARDGVIRRPEDEEGPRLRHVEVRSFPNVSETIKRVHTDDSIKWGEAAGVNHDKQQIDSASSARDASLRSGEASDDYDSHSDSYADLPVLIERYDCDSSADDSDSDSSVDIVPYTSPLGFYRYAVGKGLCGVDPPTLEEDLYSCLHNEPAAELNTRLCPSRVRLRAMTADMDVVRVRLRAMTADMDVVRVRAVFTASYRTPVSETTIIDAAVDDLALILRLANMEYRCDD
jgi:hypothetical protein